MPSHEALISVPIEHAGWLTSALARAGLTVLDTGERVTTEDRVGGEAVLCVAALDGPVWEKAATSAAPSS